MRGSPVVCLCVLLALAGCGGGVSTSTPVPEVTPAPIPEDTDLAPGLTATGVDSPARLAEGHAETVESASFTLRANRTVRYVNGTLRSRLSLRVRAAENRSYLASAATDGPAAPVFLGRPPANATFWSNGTVFVRAFTRDGETTYNRFSAPTGGAGSWAYWTKTVPFGGEQATPESFYRELFESVPVRVDARLERGGVAYRLVGDRLRGGSFRGVENVSDLRVVAVVTERGLVRSLSLRYDGSVDGERVSVERTVTYRDVGATTAPRPPWFERAVGGESD